MSKMTKEEILNQVIKTDDSDVYEIMREHHKKVEDNMNMIYADLEEYDEYAKSKNFEEIMNFTEWLNIKYKNKNKPWE